MTTNDGTATVCEIDGLPLSTHRRCTMCSILVGSGHYDVTVDGGGRCTLCQRIAAQRAAAKAPDVDVWEMVQRRERAEMLAMFEGGASLLAIRSHFRLRTTRQVEWRLKRARRERREVNEP